MSAPRETTAPVIDVAAFVTFPRSKPDTSESYIREFAHDCRGLMRAWVTKTLGDWDDVFGLSPETERDALQIADENALKELGRELTVAEATLLSGAVRDVVIVRTAMRAARELRACVASLPAGSYERRCANFASQHAAELATRLGAGSANTQGAD